MKEAIIIVRDDFDGSDAADTVTFGYRGVEYEIDLNAVNAKDFDTLMSRYISAGRVTGGRKGPSRAAMRARRAEIRDWASANGFEVSSRGAIPADALAAWKAAQAEAAKPAKPKRRTKAA